MIIDRAGFPFIAGPLALALLLLALRRPVPGGLFLVLAAFMAFFFRDPDRSVPTGEDLVVAPADGRVMVAGAAEPGVAPPGTWRQVSIFLSPLDVHVNRVPFGGLVTQVERRPGRFLPAYRAESGRENARTEVWFTRGEHVVVARQVVGVLARRIVCRLREGAAPATGERYGLMKFGSRMDVFLPPEATVTVAAGDRVRGGETPIARMAPRGGSVDGP